MCSNGPVEISVRDLKIVAHGRSSSVSVTELELFCRGELLKPTDAAGAELVETDISDSRL